MKPIRYALFALLVACTATIDVTAAQQAGANPAPTAGKQIRFKLSLVVTGNYQHTGPKTFPQGAMVLTIKQAIDNSYSTEYIVVPDSILKGLQKTNSMDPASQREMDDYNAKVKAQADRVYHSADNLRGKGSGASAELQAAMNPMAMMNDPEFMKKIMAGGQDQACQQKIAMEMMARQQQKVSGPGGKMLADVQAISDMCIKKGNKMGSKGYEDCMNAEGEKRSTVKRTAADNEAEIPELPDRYFLYRNGLNNCQFKAHAKIDYSGTDGGIDTGGYGEGNTTAKGEGDFDPKDVQPCSNAQAAFDTKTNLFWGGSLYELPVELQRTGGLAASNWVSFGPEIREWIASAMQGVPASGTKTQKFGYQTATLTWSITRE